MKKDKIEVNDIKNLIDDLIRLSEILDEVAIKVEVLIEMNKEL